jgi:hypothetical protein
MAFSKRWRDIGGELWIDPNIKVDHWWFTAYKGDFDAHLRGMKTAQDTKDAFAAVKQMAQDIKMRATAEND